jgi:hypothetical protein
MCPTVGSARAALKQPAAIRKLMATECEKLGLRAGRNEARTIEEHETGGMVA